MRAALRRELRKHRRLLLAAHLLTALSTAALYYAQASYVVRQVEVLRALPSRLDQMDIARLLAADLLQLTPAHAADQALGLLAGTAFGTVLFALVAARLAAAEFGWGTAAVRLADGPRASVLRTCLALLLGTTLSLLLTAWAAAVLYAHLAVRWVASELPAFADLSNRAEPGSGLAQLLVAWLSASLLASTAMAVALLARNALVGLVVAVVAFFGQLTLVGSGAVTGLAGLLPAVAQVSMLPEVFRYVPDAGVLHAPLQSSGAPLWQTAAVTALATALAFTIAGQRILRMEVRT